MLFFYQKIFKNLIFPGLIFFLTAASAGWGFETREVGVVMADRLNMRLNAGKGYPVVKVLEKDHQDMNRSPHGNG